MNKVVKYTVVTGNPLGKLLENMIERLHEGWQPLGGVAMVTMEQPSPGGKTVQTHFAQAVVKYEE